MLKGKTAIITSGSRGIGASIACRFASMGADIAVIYSGSHQAARDLSPDASDENGVKALAYQCDVADFEAVKETVAKIKEDFGTAHILVNNAGITCDPTDRNHERRKF